MGTETAPETPYVDFVESADELRCVFLRRMDTLASTKAETVLNEKFSALANRKIVFDLEKVDYVASSFLRLCVIASKASKGKFAMMNVTPTVRKVMKIAGFESVAEII